VPAYFIDTSALVRRYDPTEPGSHQMQALCSTGAGNLLLLSGLASVEVASALSAKVRSGALVPANGQSLWSEFLSHRVRQYRVVVIDEAILHDSERLVFTYPLRAADAIHLATAQRAALLSGPGNGGLHFCTADRRQADAARDEGLSVLLIA
jgi:uncharacterized protein